MWELVKSGGWMMLPIILSSIAAVGIIIERLWTLRASRITPPHLLGQVWRWIQDKQLSSDKLKELRADSPLGEILAAGLANSRHGREIMKECIEEAAARVIHELERYLATLGTIAAMAPLLGLLGTVLGMIDIFSSFTSTGMTGNAGMLAGGIAKALICTASGLTVAIPTIFFHRYLQNRVDELVVGMEQEAIKLVEVVQGDRDVDLTDAKPDLKAAAPWRGSQEVKFRRRKPRETIDINLVSLIDVVFILLLFFVVTTTFTRETQLRVDLPQAVTGASADDADKKHVDITINAEGVYSVNNTLLADSKLDTLIDALQKESGGDISLPLSISADGKTPHQAVITAMDAAGKLGFAHLRMTTVEAGSAN